MIVTGIMLLGPPGTGKTYAVKAVQHLCRDTCKVSFSCDYDYLILFPLIYILQTRLRFIISISLSCYQRVIPVVSSLRR